MELVLVEEEVEGRANKALASGSVPLEPDKGQGPFCSARRAKRDLVVEERVDEKVPGSHQARRQLGVLAMGCKEKGAYTVIY